MGRITRQVAIALIAGVPLASLLGKTLGGDHDAEAVGPPRAQNADTVDGFHASATPAANTLLGLAGQAKFPPSAMPMPGLAKAGVYVQERVRLVRFFNNVTGNAPVIEDRGQMETGVRFDFPVDYPIARAQRWAAR